MKETPRAAAARSIAAKSEPAQSAADLPESCLRQADQEI
jgi:hypothetical protein